MSVIISVVGCVCVFFHVCCMYFTAFSCLSLLICFHLWVSLRSSQTPLPSPETYSALLKEVSGSALSQAISVSTKLFLHTHGILCTHRRMTGAGRLYSEKQGFYFPSLCLWFLLRARAYSCMQMCGDPS